jgi:phosphotransferase system enzyme I (PtsI)
MASRTVIVGSTGGLHARPAALFVAAAQAQPVAVTIRTAAKGPVPAASMLAVLALRATFGTEVVLEAEGPSADAALDALAALVTQNLDDEPASPDAPTDAGAALPAGTPLPAAGAGEPEGANREKVVLHGIGVSPGQAAGPAYRLVPAPQLPPAVAVQDRDAEMVRAVKALREVAGDLSARALDAVDTTAAEILRAQVMMIDDPVLAEAVADAAQSGMDAAHAIDHAFASHRQTFHDAGGYLAERVTDLDDLRDRAIAGALGVPMPGVPDPGKPFVLIARDLAPADTAGLDPAQVLAIVTERGGPTSHMAIVARSLGIPAVVQSPNAMAIADGTLVTVDGATGVVTTDVSQSTVDEVREREERRRAQLAASTGDGRTADGHTVALLANIGAARDLEDPGAPKAEGVGLFRTELLYLDRTEEPSLDEQIALYTRVFELNMGKRTVVRTLDAGADKPLPFLHHDPEPNPALGVRGLRLARRHPAVLETQLRAIATAARGTGSDVWVMAPMVATAAEAADFANRCRAAGLARAGVMIEIPAAALQVNAILAVCDFVSIGTNDLSQYTFAADRECGELADLLSPWQPALLELIAMCGRAGSAMGKPVGVCGEAAADPRLAPVLVGLGVTSLSMPARAIPACREALAAHTFAQCESLAQQALSGRLG